MIFLYSENKYNYNLGLFVQDSATLQEAPGASVRLEVPRQVPCENLKLGYYYILGITEIINSITSDDDTYSDVDVSFVSTKSS